MNSELCLNVILKVLHTRETKINYILSEITGLNYSYKLLSPNHILLAFVDFPAIIPKYKENGLFNLRVPSGNGDAYRVIVSPEPESYILCGSVHKYLSNSFTSNISYNRGLVGASYSTYGFGGCQISVDTAKITPAFKLPLSQWPSSDPLVPAEVRKKFPWFYAIPWETEKNDDDRTFSVCAPEWEDELLMQQPKSIEIIKLMNHIRQQNAESLPKLTHYMLKTVVLKQLPISNWQRDWVSLFSEMWTRLADHLRAGRLDSFLCEGLNLDCMDSKELAECVATTRQLLFKILEARYNNTRNDAKTLFGIHLE